LKSKYGHNKSAENLPAPISRDTVALYGMNLTMAGIKKRREKTVNLSRFFLTASNLSWELICLDFSMTIAIKKEAWMQQKRQMKKK
jgi:hypothetical protein